MAGQLALTRELTQVAEISDVILQLSSGTPRLNVSDEARRLKTFSVHTIDKFPSPATPGL